MDNYNGNSNYNNYNNNYNPNGQYSNYNNSGFQGGYPNGGNAVPPQKPKSKFGIGLLVGILITIAAVMLLAVIAVFIFFRGMRTGTAEMDYQEKLDTIQMYLDNYYLYDLDEEQMENALAAGLLNGIGDKYAKYYSKEEFDQLMEETSGSYGGIGISIIMNDDNQVEVYKVFDGSPAAEAGIQIKDVIVEAAGVRDFEDIDELVSLVRGEQGTTVDIVTVIAFSVMNLAL